MKTLYLHIGTTKTATTSIQRFLEENKDVLQKYGYCFPDSLHVYPRANKRRNAHFLVAKVWRFTLVRHTRPSSMRPNSPTPPIPPPAARP